MRNYAIAKAISRRVNRNTLMICVAVSSSLNAAIHLPSGSVKKSPPTEPKSATMPVKNLSEAVASTGKHVTEQFNNNRISLNPGRQSLANLMIKEPTQIVADLPRMPTIRIGGQKIPYEWRKGQTADSQFALIANLIEDFVKKQPIKLRHRNIAGRVGRFWTVEIIYAMAQTFSAPAQISAYENNELLKTLEWGAEEGQAKLGASIYFSEAKPSILIVSLTTEKELVNLINGRDRKKFVTKAKVIFDLADGYVSYYHQYKVDSQMKSWFTAR